MLIKFTLISMLLASGASANTIGLFSSFTGTSGSSSNSFPVYVTELSNFKVTATVGGNGGLTYPSPCGRICSSSVYGTVSFGGNGLGGGALINCGGLGCDYEYFPINNFYTVILPAGVYTASASVYSSCDTSLCQPTTTYVRGSIEVLSGSVGPPPTTTPEPATWGLMTLPLAGLLWRHRYGKRHRRQG